MKIRVRLFALYREAAGTSELTLEMPEASTVDGLLAEMVRRYPRLSAYNETLMAAVNAEYASGSHVLHEGDEVALIPPVSGGGSV